MPNLPLQIRRGLHADLPVLDEGEPGYTTDTHELYIGTGATNIKVGIYCVNFSADIDAIGSSEETLIIHNQQNVTADKTVPSNITLKFQQGGSLSISSGKTVTINGHTEAGLYQIFYGSGTVVFGSGSVKEVYPQWWGAKGDDATDDTAAIQAAVNACLADSTRPLVLKITGRCKLTSSIIVNRLVDLSITKGAFRIIGEGKAAGFYVSSAIDMFSSSFSNGSHPVSEAISFENIQFEASSPSLAAYVLDGEKFLRIQFLNCRFSYMKCLTSTIYTQSIYFTKCIMREWAGTFYSSTQALDVSFEGNFIEWGEDFFADSVSVLGFRFINNLLEGCSGRPLDLTITGGSEVSGNYFEFNTCASPYIDFGQSHGVSLSGNAFLLTAAQAMDPAYFAVHWGATTGASSQGNFCNGRLDDVTGMCPSSFISVGNTGEISAMGTRLSFPATAIPSTDPNTIDDYKEGTWTMGVTFGGGTTGITYGTQEGYFTKIGNVVTISGYMTLTSKGSSTGTAAITGLPYIVGGYAAVTMRLTAITFANQYQGYTTIGQQTISLEEVTEAGVMTNLTDADFANNSTIMVNCMYWVQ
jgi:hypothetical protein